MQWRMEFLWEILCEMLLSVARFCYYKQIWLVEIRKYLINLRVYRLKIN